MLLVKVMVPTVLVLMITHVLEVIVWAFAYFVVGAAPVDADRVYFAFVNYTTLGYGDVVPVAHWRLLGPLTAMNGMLLFGWSTAVIFEVLRKATKRIGLRTAHFARRRALGRGRGVCQSLLPVLCAVPQAMAVAAFFRRRR